MIKKLKLILVFALALSMLAGCLRPAGNLFDRDDDYDKYDYEDDEDDDDEDDDRKSSSKELEQIKGRYERPSLIKKELKTEEKPVSAHAPEYEIAPDLSNIYNRDLYCLDEEETRLISQNGFFVYDSGFQEFFDIYEINRYDYRSNFITVDSLMHTYHLYFCTLLRNTERKYLAPVLLQLSVNMLKNSMAQYDNFKGTDFEDAAKRNVAFFAVGLKLLSGESDIPDYVSDIVEKELSSINDASGISGSYILEGLDEDYSQYTPRGYYEGEKELEGYFKAMMWYGRMHFKQDVEDFDRSALLITKALVEDEDSYDLWNSIYAVTAFFSGVSDDAGVAEYAQVMLDAYGTDYTDKDISNNKSAFKDFHKMTKNVKVPQINSLPIWETDPTNIIPGFRFMGQRFTIDASVMQRLLYRTVEENSSGEKRMLPDVLDFPAALGNDTALEILKEQGATDYKNYSENMAKLRDEFSDENAPIWTSSLYSSWLHTLRPVLNEDRTGYPLFMQSKEWAKKDLETFAGSYTELKHDTVLYNKQVIAEMGGGEIDEWDDRGYVEPEPLVYSRFIELTRQTRDGLADFDMLDDTEEEDLDKLETIAENLLSISEKELSGELPTDEEFDFIREYGGNIEHFWYRYAKETNMTNTDPDYDENFVSTQEFPAPVVTDIATDPNGTVLELGTGGAASIYVIVKVDDKVKIASGSVYSFYQFEQPLSERLTDSEWRTMLGFNYDYNLSYEENLARQNEPDKPEWTQGYRYKRVFNYY